MSWSVERRWLARWEGGRGGRGEAMWEGEQPARCTALLLYTWDNDAIDDSLWIIVWCVDPFRFQRARSSFYIRSEWKVDEKDTCSRPREFHKIPLSFLRCWYHIHGRFSNQNLSRRRSFFAKPDWCTNITMPDLESVSHRLKIPWLPPSYEPALSQLPAAAPVGKCFFRVFLLLPNSANTP